MIATLSVTGYIFSVLAALLVAVRWISRNDPGLRDSPLSRDELKQSRREVTLPGSDCR